MYSVLAAEEYRILTSGQVPSYTYTRPPRKLLRTLLLIAFLTFLLWQLRPYFALALDPTLIVAPLQPEKFPVSKLIGLPRQRAAKIPKIQHAPASETRTERKLREARLQEVKETFLHAWTGYRKEAWGKDELRPVNGGHKSPFCGWAATLVDSLDTLLIMGLHSEFEDALLELEKVDFVTTEGCQINLFEMTIRHLGGLLSAYDLSGGRKVLIEKALELAGVLFTAFDTENRMPTPHFEWSL
jgi:mannosyl-oligosaccharide alpha-1,2-mannosidase